MAGIVAYSDSSEDEDDAEDKNIPSTDVIDNDENTLPLKRLIVVRDDLVEAKPSKKARNKTGILPLPSSISGLFDDKKLRKDTGMHQGRTRSFDHVDGNWPTFIFIPVKLPAGYQRYCDLILETASKEFPDIQAFDKKELHISLSRTVPIRHYWIQPILDQLKLISQKESKFSYDIKEMEIYTNDEKTRTFVGLNTSSSFQNFSALVDSVDEVLSEFGLEKYYVNPVFHISFLWHLGDLKKELNEKLLTKVNPFDSASHISSINSNCMADFICMKTGNKICRFPLQ